jgi:hypothetical protein
MPDNNLTDAVAEGRTLLAEATEGPWEADGSEIYRADAYEDGTGRRVWVGETCDVDNDSLGDANAELIVWMRNNLPSLFDRIETLQLGGQTLGKSLVTLNQIALDATGMHDVINENGDGDWGAVWENVADLGADLRAARKRIAEVEAERDAAISIARSNSHALDKARAELTRSWADREEELSAIAAKQFRDAKRIAELEAQVQR